MAHQEACQLFIEQEIKEGLAQGKTPYSIGKELSSWEEKVLETSIPAKTIETRAYREKEKLTSNEVSPTTTENHLKYLNKRPNQPLTNTAGQFVKGTAPGPGRAPKNANPKPSPKYQEYMEAVDLATIAISQLSRVRDNDPYREKGFQMVLDWLTEKLKTGRRS